MWQDLIRTYEMLNSIGCVAPVAHARVTAHIGIMLDVRSNILAAAEIHERRYVPCTAKSESRTSAAAPHVIDDNVSYIADLESEKHEKYMAQLQQYISSNTHGIRAEIVYNYLKRNTIVKDLKNLLDLNDKKNKGLVIIFGIAGMPDETIDNDWIKYYLGTLPKNGLCAITGLPDYIPDAYPTGIRFPGDRTKLMIANSKDALSNVSHIRPGYVASQKIIHALQALCEEPEQPSNISPTSIVLRAYTGELIKCQ